MLLCRKILCVHKTNSPALNGFWTTLLPDVLVIFFLLLNVVFNICSQNGKVKEKLTHVILLYMSLTTL